MFRRIRALAEPVRIDFEGQAIEADAGDSVAAALLSAGVIRFGESVPGGTARGPHCLIGNCFDCLLDIDGEPGLQSCRVKVRPGMRVRRQAVEFALSVPDED